MSEATKDVAEKRGYDPAVLRALQASLYPNASLDSIRMVVDYCIAQRLDPFSKPVHLVPMRTKEQGRWVTRDSIMIGINLYRIRADRTGHYDSISEPIYGPPITRTFKGKARSWSDDQDERSQAKEIEITLTFPEWCKIVVRKRNVMDKVTEWPAIEYWLENYATTAKDSELPNAMWQKRAYGQLAKCAEAQALRKAFPDAVGAEPTFEERGIDDAMDAVVSTQAAGSSTVADKPIEPTTEPAKAQTRSDSVLDRVKKPTDTAQGATPAADPLARQPSEPIVEPGASGAVVGDGGKSRQSEIGGDDWLDYVFASPTLDAAPLAVVIEIGQRFDVLFPSEADAAYEAGTLPLEDEQRIRALMLTSIRLAYVNKARPALQAWASDLIGKYGDCSTKELDELIAESTRIAKPLAALGEDGVVKVMHNAASVAKRRLGLTKKKGDTNAD